MERMDGTTPEPQQVQSRQAGPREAEPREAQPREAQPREAQPREAQPREAQPREAQPRRAQPQQAQPREAEPRRAQPQQAQPRQAPQTPGLLPLLPGFREIAMRRMSEERRKLITDLAAQRHAARLSQTEVAARMGTSQSAVARLETGAADVRASTLERYAAAIGCEITWRLRD